jgi:hypothetical protein
MINVVTMAQPREVKMFQGVLFWDVIDLTGNADLAAQLDLISPHKIDENTWRNREQVEEILFLLHKDNWPSSVSNFNFDSVKVLSLSVSTTFVLEDFWLVFLDIYSHDY